VWTNILYELEYYTLRNEWLALRANYTQSHVTRLTKFSEAKVVIWLMVSSLKDKSIPVSANLMRRKEVIFLYGLMTARLWSMRTDLTTRYTHKVVMEIHIYILYWDDLNFKLIIFDFFVVQNNNLNFPKGFCDDRVFLMICDIRYYSFDFILNILRLN